MSAERFGAVYFDSTNQDTFLSVATGAALYDSSIVVNFCNQNTFAVSICLAYLPTTTQSNPANADFLEFRRVLGPHESFRTPAIAMSQTGRLAARSNLGGVSVVAYGYRDEI